MAKRARGAEVLRHCVKFVTLSCLILTFFLIVAGCNPREVYPSVPNGYTVYCVKDKETGYKILFALPSEFKHDSDSSPGYLAFDRIDGSRLLVLTAAQMPIDMFEDFNRDFASDSTTGTQAGLENSAFYIHFYPSREEYSVVGAVTWHGPRSIASVEYYSTGDDKKIVEDELQKIAGYLLFDPTLQSNAKIEEYVGTDVVFIEVDKAK